jgi:prolyl-tRNA synthetase
MRQSQLFTKTRKEAPADEVSKNAALLIRAGYVHKEMAGVYSYLPLGLAVLSKIENIIREEMNAIGGQELLLSALHPKENWQATGRWDELDVLFKLKDAADHEYALGATHEEIITPLAKEYISSYRDLPFSTYQIQNKFRAELRSKSGILRGREFIMKDLYSFHRDQEDLDRFYDIATESYKKIFARVGIGDLTYFTYASGGTFSKYSHEFQTLTDAGEDIIYVNKEKGIAVNEEVLEDETLQSLGVTREDLEPIKAAEVGNIFKLGTKYSGAFDLTYKDENGESQPVIMGCYGIGLGRLMGVVVESLADEKGIVWPESIAPFKVHLVGLNSDDSEVKDFTDGIYLSLKEKGVEVLYDDRDLRAGEKFADSDLIGIPYRVIVSKKSKEEGKFEVITRATGEVRLLTEEELYADFDNDENT